MKIASETWAQPIQPAPHVRDFYRDGPKEFPFIYQLLVSTLGKGASYGQLGCFLGWLHRAYADRLLFGPARGPILVLAGGPASGKTLLAKELISPLLGGGFEVGDTSRISDWLAAPVALVDMDGECISGRGQHSFFNTLRRWDANLRQISNPMYDSGDTLLWEGRLVILAGFQDGDAPLEGLDADLKSRVCMFKTSHDPMLPGAILHLACRMKTVREELPSFARYLLDDPRLPEFAKHTFQHPELCQ